MKCTELYNFYKALEEHEKKELIAAVKAHGGEYVFIHVDEDEEVDEDELYNAPVVSGSWKHQECLQDYRISRIKVETIDTDLETVTIFGWPNDPNWPDEDEITEVAYNHLGYITSQIPETETVNDVSIPFDWPNHKNS